MFELTVSHEFCAAHAIVINGEREPVHGHNWRVRLTVSGGALDADGLLCDFHLVDRLLRETVAPFENGDLNATAPFDEVNPTAEHIARHIGDRVAENLPAGVRIARVAITEAPGCEAVYLPGT
ncbi:MAG: 6-pyruvoyl tetrahydropterin synthase family protein [Phycisphaerales bacterium]